MRLEQFQYVVEIAHCKSMSKASKKLYITQPSLSTAIQNFEDELGFQIFKRSSQGVTLTDKGAILLDIAENIVKNIDEVKELSSPDSELTNNITIAAVPVICNAFMISLIQKLHNDKNYNINLQLQEFRPAKILPAMLSESCDLALGMYYPSTKEQTLQEAARYNLVVEPIFDDAMYAFLPRNHRLALEESIAVTDLANDTPIFFTGHMMVGRHDDDNENQSELKNHYYSFNDRNSIKQAIAKGLGYSIMPRLMAVDDVYVNSGMIVAKPLSDTDISMTIFLAYPGKHSLTKAERLIIDTIKEQFKVIKNDFAEFDSAHTKQKSDINHNNMIFY